jgi:hypothetical protein
MGGRYDVIVSIQMGEAKGGEALAGPDVTRVRLAPHPRPDEIFNRSLSYWYCTTVTHHVRRSATTQLSHGIREGGHGRITERLGSFDARAA